MASVVTTAITGAPTLVHLPNELLDEIMSLVPVAPRIRVCSLVSRRWRSAVLRSIRDVALLTVSDAFAARLPNISRLHLSLFTPACLLRSALTDLRIDLSRPPRAVDYRARLVELSTLTRIDLTIGKDDAWVATVVRANAAHLRSLALYSNDRVCAPLASLLELTLPSLTCLKIDHKALSASPLPAAAFVARHAAQLTSFGTFAGPAPAAILESLKRGDFRTLRKLNVSCDPTKNSLFRQAIAALGPSVTSIALHLHRHSNEALPIIAAAGTRLRKLHMGFTLTQPDALRDTLRACTRLNSVSLLEPLLRAAAAGGCQIAKLGKCQIGPADLCLFTSLREADLSTHTHMRSEFIPPSLPALRRLNVSVSATGDAASIVRRLLHAAPRLASLELSFACEWVDTDLTALRDVCAVAAPSLLTLWMYVRLTQADIDALIAPALPRPGWLSVQVASNYC